MKKQLLRPAFLITVVMTILVLGVWREISNDRTLVPVARCVDAGNVDPGEKVRLTFSFLNRGTSSARLIGMEESCGLMGCVKLVGYTYDVKPGGTGTMTVEFRNRGKLGACVHKFRIFGYDRSALEFPCEIKCHVRAFNPVATRALTYW